MRSVYDVIFSFLCRHGLPAGAVWFVNGNFGGLTEYQSWKRPRLGNEDAPEPFETRFIEPFSYMAQLTRRERERGFGLTGELGSHAKWRWPALSSNDASCFGAAKAGPPAR